MNKEIPLKHDLPSSKFSEHYYADVSSYMGRRVELIETWGLSLLPGDSILELGCGDGFLLGLLAERGFTCYGLDYSEGMVEASRQRCHGLISPMNIWQGDLNDQYFLEKLPERIDCAVSFRTFDLYCHNWVGALKVLRSVVSKKVVIDIDPRRRPLGDLLQAFREAGFLKVNWRPFFVPQKKKLGTIGLHLLRTLENVPGARWALLQVKFTALVKGEI